ncbi:MAG: glycosyltransferase family 87 protein [Candidatus Cloacimonadales bacterium]|nr:glycosyltransferase family 87 protein [Candidatus Cloacimonadales bacterium]
MNQNKDLILNVLLIFVVFITITGFLQDISNTMKFGGVDLRNRVVGARLLKADFDPYFFKWKQGDPLELLDPRDRMENEVNMVTVTPATLLLLSPFTKIRYNLQRFIWFALQWLLFLSSIYLFVNTSDSSYDKKFIWLLCLFFIDSSLFWRLHVERGQIYIFYVFMISLVYFIIHSKLSSAKLISGIVLGIAIIFRPTLVLIALTFLIFKNWKFIIGTLIGSVAAFVSSLLLVDWQDWQSYFNAMKIHANNHLSNIQFAESNYPYTNIEGIGNLYGLANIPVLDTSLQFLLKSIGIRVSEEILMFILLMIIVTVFLILRKIYLTTSQIFLTGCVLIFLADFFLPAARFPYNNVMFLPVLAILILERNNLLEVFNPDEH